MNIESIESTMFIERDDFDIEVVITAEYEPGCPGQRWDRNFGGTPPAPPCLWGVAATYAGKKIVLSAREMERAEEILWEKVA
jgi:hypothetical protein